MQGPNKSYIYHGFSNFHSSAGLNTLTLTNSGKRSIEFKDGSKFDFEYSKVRKLFLVNFDLLNYFINIIIFYSIGSIFKYILWRYET